jgi:EF hand
MLKSSTTQVSLKNIVLSALTTMFLFGATAQVMAADAETKVIAKDATTKDMKAPADADFTKLDVNADGKVSLKEAVKDKTLSSSFDVVDANKDGNIAGDEYASFKAAKSMDSVAPTGTAPTEAPASKY